MPKGTTEEEVVLTLNSKKYCLKNLSLQRLGIWECFLYIIHQVYVSKYCSKMLSRTGQHILKTLS